jgi:hypothetical protein
MKLNIAGTTMSPEDIRVTPDQIRWWQQHARDCFDKTNPSQPDYATMQRASTFCYAVARVNLFRLIDGEI